MTKQIKTVALKFSLSQGFFFSLSLSIFLIKLPYILKRAREKQNHIFVCFDAVVKWSCCVANKEKKQQCICIYVNYNAAFTD